VLSRPGAWRGLPADTGAIKLVVVSSTAAAAAAAAVEAR